MVELSRAAASSAAHGHHSRIRLEDIVDNLENFGKRRIDDTIAEFSSQCPEVEELIAAFSHAQKEYTTQELVDLIKKKISDHLTPRIEGVVGKPNHLDIAAFLFEIGFLSARRDRPDGTYEHVSFSDEPTLLRSRSNPVDGVTWEIHPVFAEGLGLHGHKSSRKVTR